MNHLKIENNDEPIFIHSLFRSGSTYIFKKFRDNEKLYTCFQEPVHEISLLASTDFDLLNKNVSDDENKALRHPRLNKSYFAELYDIAENTLHYLVKEDIYHNYFDNNASSLCKYLRAIIENSDHRCVIQECRLTSRMSGIKEEIGGIHLYLWRNPWDQWWSYQVTDYFDAANLLILNANNPPALIDKIVKKLGVQKYNNDDFQKILNFYKNNKLDAKNSYFLFYAIWLLSLIEAPKHADFIFNIDKLSSCDDYRELVHTEFSNRGILGVNFSDCKVPQSCFGEEDLKFFSNIESAVHELFLDVGYESKLLDEALTLRREFYPNTLCSNHSSDYSKILSDSEKARALARASITELSVCYKNKNLIIKDLEEQVEDREQKIIEKTLHYDEILNQYNALLSSNSWRITKPIRFLSVETLKIKGKMKNILLKILQHSFLFLKARPALLSKIIKAISKSNYLEEKVNALLPLMRNKQKIKNKIVLSERGNEILKDLRGLNK